MITLVKRDTKGKIRVVEVSCAWDDDEHAYAIDRTTYQYGGKHTPQPRKYIYKGKANRTVTEQAKLECNSILNKYKDDGYKQLEGNIDEYKQEDLFKILPEHTTDANGFAKHMLAKPAKDVKESSIEKVKEWWVSRKIDGVRCSFYWDGEQIRSASRGGKDYDYSTHHFRDNEKLIAYFQEHPDVVLDGELYKHGKSLQQISGAARMEKNAYDMDWLEYYIYDVMVPELPFSERLDILKELTSELNLSFEPERKWEEGELQMQIVPQVLVKGDNKVKQLWKLHDEYVAEGWEGCVARDASKSYGFGSRTNSMIKFKNYQSEEFLIVGYELGLRGNEDMVFICITSDGKQFKAKPHGDKLQKDWYVENFGSECLNHYANVKFFYYSDEGTPLQPSVSSIRIDADMPN